MRRFEAAWKAGSSPKSKTTWALHPGHSGLELQRELEKIDAEYRLKAKAKAPPGSPTPAKPQAGGAGQPAKPQAFDPYYQWLGHSAEVPAAQPLSAVGAGAVREQLRGDPRCGRPADGPRSYVPVGAEFAIIAENP